MIVDPAELKTMAVNLGNDISKQHAVNLINYHKDHSANDASMVIVPIYWAETILAGLKEMRVEFPHLKFGSILEDKNRLKMFTIPTFKKIIDMRIALCNKIDMLILETVDRVAKGGNKS